MDFNWEQELDLGESGLTQTVCLRDLSLDLVLGKAVDPKAVLAVLDAMEEQISQARTEAEEERGKVVEAEEEMVKACEERDALIGRITDLEAAAEETTDEKIARLENQIEELEGGELNHLRNQVRTLTAQLAAVPKRKRRGKLAPVLRLVPAIDKR